MPFGIRPDAKGDAAIGEETNQVRGREHVVLGHGNAGVHPARTRKVTIMKDVDEGLGGTHCSSSTALVSAMRVLANDVQSDDGVANAAIREAADRIEQLEASIKQIHKDYGCEVLDPCGTIWEYADRLRSLLVEVLENDEVESGFNNANLGEDLKRKIMIAVGR